MKNGNEILNSNTAAMPFEPLTKTHLQILPLLADGLTAEEIARLRCRSLDTVQHHIKEMRARMGARNIAHLIALAVRAGVLQLCLVLSVSMAARVDDMAARRPPALRIVRVVRTGHWES